jgi:hypothetical protein
LPGYWGWGAWQRLLKSLGRSTLFWSSTKAPHTVFCSYGFRGFASGGLQRVGFNKNPPDGWLLLANTGFQPINGGFSLPDIQAATKPDVYK